MAERKNQDNIVSGTVHLVVRVRRKKSDHSQVDATVLGAVSTVFSFKTMCDFQYLPVRPIADTGVYEDLVPKLVPTDFTSALTWWDQGGEGEQTPHFLPPFLFSRWVQFREAITFIERTSTS